MFRVWLTRRSPGLVLSSIATIVLAYLFPAQYDWVSTRAIAQADDDAPTNAKDDPRTIEAGTPVSSSHAATSTENEKVLDARKGSAATTIVVPTGEGEGETDIRHGKEQTTATVTPTAADSMASPSPESDDADDDDEKEPDRAELQRVFVRASWISGIMALIITIVSDPVPPRQSARPATPLQLELQPSVSHSSCCTDPRGRLPLTQRRSYPSRCSSAGTSSPRASSPSGSPWRSSGSSAPASSACGSGVYHHPSSVVCSVAMLIVQVSCLCGSRGDRSPSSPAGRWGCASGWLQASKERSMSIQRTLSAGLAIQGCSDRETVPAW